MTVRPFGRVKIVYGTDSALEGAACSAAVETPTRPARPRARPMRSFPDIRTLLQRVSLKKPHNIAIGPTRIKLSSDVLVAVAGPTGAKCHRSRSSSGPPVRGAHPR